MLSGRRRARAIDEIRRYLKAHPHAADTAGGIAAWWLSDERVDAAEIASVLDELVERGELVRQTVGTSVVYRARRCTDA